MFVTSDYNKVAIESGKFKYKFFVNNRDNYENEMDFVKKLNTLILRFSEDLADKGLVVKTYNSCIKNVRKEILAKQWGPFSLETIRKTPGILMIDTDFDEFNPNRNNWIYFHFIRDQRFKKNRGNSFTIEEAEELFDRLSEIIAKDNNDIFKEVKTILIKEKAKRIGKAVAKEIGNCAIGISADKFLNILIKL